MTLTVRTLALHACRHVKVQDHHSLRSILHACWRRWSNDAFFYPFCTLPELVVMIIDVWPTLYARMCQRYPTEAPEAGDKQHQGRADPERGVPKQSLAVDSKESGLDTISPAWAHDQSFLGPRGVANGQKEPLGDDSVRQGSATKSRLGKALGTAAGDQDILSSQTVLLTDSAQEEDHSS